MSSLRIVIGFNGPGASATPSAVYVGNSGQGARDAMADSDAHRFLVLDNPIGYRKSNPRVRPDAVAEVAPVETVAPVVPKKKEKKKKE